MTGRKEKLNEAEERTSSTEDNKRRWEDDRWNCVAKPTG